MVESYTFYVHNIWSQNETKIIGRKYLVIYASEVTIKKIIEDYNLNDVDKFFKVLDGMGIKYENIKPISLDEMMFAKRE